MSEEDFLTTEEQAILQSALEETHQEIPTNSKSLFISDTTSRFSSALWYDNIQNKEVVLAGVGGIGSYVAYNLSRLQCKRIIVYDPDKVETVNMSGQLFNMQQVGMYKSDAVYNTVVSYSGYHRYYSYRERYTEYSTIKPIMICGFDNMEARKVFFANWLKGTTAFNAKDCLFIDGRLAAEEFQILCIRGDDEYNIKRYQEEFLFTDEEADATICSYKQTTFCANMIASYITNLFVNFCANQCDPLIDRDLPFYTSYNAETMFLKTEK